MDMQESCPACGQANALIALGARHDRPYRWRPWVSRWTYLYLCDRCDALVEAPERRLTLTVLRPVYGAATA